MGKARFGGGRTGKLVPIKEAATLLNVSRPHVVMLIDEGTLPTQRVGAHRRLHLQDVGTYKRKPRMRPRALLEELAEQAQDLGLGY